MPDTGLTEEGRAWLGDVLGVTLATTGDAPPALAAWQSARATAIASLNALADKVATLDIPESSEAVILLRAIRANLTESPTTARQQAELRAYLQTDDIIADAEEPNGFGIKIDLRAPLLAALDAIAPGTK